MALVVQQSLLEAGDGTPMVDSALWIEGVLLDEIALGVCVIAVALIGALMLTGRLPLRQGMRVVIGCFVLLGAPIVAAGLLDLGARSSSKDPPIFQAMGRNFTRPELPEAKHNPYAQASVRED